MATRPTWRGHLRLALVSCPVRLTPATTSSSNIRFHKLNKKTGNRLRQQMIDAETGKVVERDETIMGYEFEKGKYVKVEPEEIEALKIESSEIITIERIVKAAEVDLLFQETPYIMEPDDKNGLDIFATIREALKAKDVVGIGRLVLSRREHPVMIQPRGKGIMLTTLLCIVTWFLARRRDYPRMPKASWAETWYSFRDSIWGLLLVVIIIGGIYSGLFTATEAAAMAAVYSFFIAIFVYKAIGFKDVPRVLLRAANTSAMLLYIITNAVLFSFVLSNENIPSALADWITAQNLGWVGFLFVVNILLLLAGNFMEPNSIILIMAPILAPAAKKLGIDLVHFGIVIDVNMEVGLCHPPVGLNLYVASMIARMRITDLAVAVLPWLCTMLGFLVVVTYWPELTLFLPRLLGMH